MSDTSSKSNGVVIAVVAVGAAMIALTWFLLRPSGPGAGFTRGYGQIEVTTIQVASRLPGRIDSILVDEGALVESGQPLAVMQVQVLQAERNEAHAQHQQAITDVANAQAQIALRESDKAAAQALMAQRESELDAAQRRFRRTSALAAEGAASAQELEDDRAALRSARAGFTATEAQVAAAQSAIDAARAQVSSSRAAVEAAQAAVGRIDANITDSQLVSPRNGRVYRRLAQPGEVLAPGDPVLTLFDLADVHMVFHLTPDNIDRAELGAEVRVVLDAAPGYVIPAVVSSIADNLQLGPTGQSGANARQRLGYRIKARVDSDLVQRLPFIEDGLSGTAWVKTDPEATWPANLSPGIPN